MTLTLSFRFSAAHFYNQSKWSAEKNSQVFGLCYTTYGHGHNYDLQVSVSLSDDSLTSFAKQELQACVLNALKDLDHQHLNFTLPYFNKNIPTTENIAHYIWQKISQQQKQPTFQLQRIKLYEMPDLWVELTA